MHKEHYIDWVGRTIGFPVETDPGRLMKFITVDANHKYVQPIAKHWLDDIILAGCQPDRENRLNR